MKAYGFKLCCRFSFPIGVCTVLMSISAAYVMIGSYISRMSANYTFATVYKEDTLKKSRLSMSLHVAITRNEFYHNT